MSYHTFANLQYTDGEQIALSPSDAELLRELDDARLHHDVAKSLAALFEGQEAWFAFHGGCAALEPLLCKVSRRWPEVAFGVQGRGEDLRDVWVREFLAGEVTFERGPFVE